MNNNYQMLRKNIKLVKPLCNTEPNQTDVQNTQFKLPKNSVLSGSLEKHCSQELQSSHNNSTRIPISKLTLRDKLINTHSPLMKSKQNFNQLTFRSTNPQNKNTLNSQNSFNPIISEFSSSIDQQIVQNYCLNHQYISAHYQISDQNQKIYYYCENCANKLQKQGFNPKPLSKIYKKLICLNRSKNNKQMERLKNITNQKKQIQTYLAKTNLIIEELHENTVKLQQQRSTNINLLNKNIQQLQVQKDKQILLIQSQYKKNKQNLQEQYKKKDKSIQQTLNFLKLHKNNIYQAREDILNNLNNIEANIFSENQFRKIMNVYWEIPLLREFQNCKNQNQSISSKELILIKEIDTHRSSQHQQQSSKEKDKFLSIKTNQQLVKPMLLHQNQSLKNDKTTDSQGKTAVLKLWNKQITKIVESDGEQESQSMNESLVDKKYQFY